MTSAKEAMLTVAGADSFSILKRCLDTLKIKCLTFFYYYSERNYCPLRSGHF